MGETAENIYEQTGISRERQDAFALESHRRAVNAINAGKFKAEMVPVVIPQRKGDSIVVDTDEQPRMKWSAESDQYELATSLDILASLKPAFREGGVVTAGNASGINDGAAAVLIMSASKARELGLKALASIGAAATAGVDPRYMGYGPIPATRKVFERSGLSAQDMDVIELNEAFAVQALAVMDQLALPPERVNVNGGAIALGHPLGCSGARLVATILQEMKRRQHSGMATSPYGLVSLCVGVGQGVSMILKWAGE
jgi:acetyl-CoA acetyltransferase family protein